MIFKKLFKTLATRNFCKFLFILSLILIVSANCKIAYGQEGYENELPNIKPCGNIFYDFSDFNRALPANCNDVRTEGYGPGCVNTDSSIPALPQPACGKYRVPIAFRKIAEDDCSGLPADIDQRLDDELCYLNEIFCDLNIEFFECPRPDPICNSDFFDFDAQTAGDDDDTQIQSENIPDVINIYIPNTIIGFNGNPVGGYAPVGGNSGNPRMLAGLGQIGQYPANVAGCGITACGATGQMYPTIAHEMGHFFGCRHPFLNNAGGADLVDNSLCCNQSDFTCDTDPDPYEISMSGGSGCNGAPSCTYNGTDLDATGNQYNSYTTNNIMGYWPFSCATIFTPFQKRRMYDALIYCNTYLCCTTPEAYLLDATLQEQTICKNEALPDIMGLADRCFDWYDDDDAAATLITGAATTLTAAQLSTVVNNAVPGTYTVYMQDANSYQDPPCRVPVTINVLAEPGDASGNGMATVPVNNCDAAENVQLATDVDVLADGCVVGWWITETNPANNGIVNDATLTVAVGGATIGAPINNPVNNIIESTGGNPINELSLSFDCSSLDENLTYYATPVVAKSSDVIPDIICNDNMGNGDQISVNNGDVDGSIIQVPCPANCLATATGEDANFTVTINITTFNETLPASINIRIRDGSCTNNLVSTAITISSLPTTITFTDADFDADYDPCTDMCIFLLNFNSPFTQGSPTIEFNYDLDVTYPGAPAVVFPSLNSYSDCLFGAPVEISCNCVEPPCDEMAGEPNATTETVCATGTETGAGGELLQAGVDLTTFFPGPNSDDPNDPDDVTNYFSFDAATGGFVSASSNTTIDLSNLGCAGEACVKEIVYTQSILNDFVDGLNAIPGVNLGSPDLSGLFTQLNNLFGPYTETDINNILMNGITILGVTVPWPTPFCYDFSDTQICFTVENCSPPCDLTTCNSVDLVICNLGWSGLGDQFTVGTEGTDADLELAWSFGGLGGTVYDFDGGADNGSFNPGITFNAGITDCPGTVNATIDAEICIWENDCDADNTFNEETEPACEIIPGTIFTPPVTNGDDPLLGTPTNPCGMVTFDFSTASGSTSITNGAYTFTFDYLPVCTSSVCECPVAAIVADDTGDVCGGDGTDDFSAWQAAINAANPLDADLVANPNAQDPCGFGTIVYSSIAPTDGTTSHDDILVDGSYTGDNCANEAETTMAYLYCDLDNTDNTGDETYQLISTYTLTVWPAIQAPTIDNDGDCGPFIGMLPCAGYTVTNDYDANGATPDFSAEMAMGNINFTLTNPGAPAACLSLDVPASFNCNQPAPMPAFDCPGPTVNLCSGAVNLNAVDNEPATAGTSTGAWTGSGAAFVVLNGTGIGDDVFDPSGAPVGVQLTLILTLTDNGQSTSTVECTFMVIRDCTAEGGSF